MSELPRVMLRPRRAQPFYGRHPWVFAGAVLRVEGDPQPGDEVALVSNTGEFIARGLFNPHSGIRVRLYSWDEATALDEFFWRTRLGQAISLRRDRLGWWGPESGCRLVFSEADGLSGLIVDRYGDWLLVQCTSLALFHRRELLVRLLNELLHPAGIWLRTEKGIREAEGLEVADQLLSGSDPPRPLLLEENGLRFAVDVVEGQKTGFFLDQRLNRRAFLDYLPAGRMLDVCCFSGGFALQRERAAQVTEVVGVDVSAPALELAARNAELNGLSHRVRFQKGDAFKTLEALRGAGEKFDTVVLDPPKLARHAAGVDEALRGYHGLNRLALELVNPGGLLVTCSCTGHVTRAMFEEVLADAATSARRHVEVLEGRGAAPDHPVSVHCPETAYLKCLICRVL
ncbi:MAG: class I SAM-dependent rRNA methyltransferase [Planctomycetaceae bacterium]|nr:MAG: class I SAM-dependent rRNA methyltransferase [Planctomycetaceae bacterium]